MTKPVEMTPKARKAYNEAQESIQACLNQGEAGKFLEISHHDLTELPPEIGQLTALGILNLYSTALKTLPPEIGGLTALRKLYLRENALTTLPPEIVQLTALSSLNLNNNQLTTLPPEIGQLTALSSLILIDNQLKALPPEIRNLKALNKLFLHGNLDLGIPADVLGPSWVEVEYGGVKPADPTAILDYYFAQQAVGARSLNEVKLLLVGRGGAGKTSIVEHLIRGEFDPHEESTTGIALQDWELKCPGGDPVTVHVWDFAGQMVTHATHQFFLSARSVYILVLTAREDSQREDAEYWLKLIRAFGTEAGETSPVIVALNKWADAPVKLDREMLREKYPFVAGFVETDCKTGLGMGSLKKMLAGIVGEDPWVRSKTGAEFFRVKEALRDRWHASKINHLNYEDYRAVCDEQGLTDPERQQLVAVNLHNLGLALNYGNDPRLRDTTVLNPHWVTESIYKLLRDVPNKDGELSFRTARGYFKDETPRMVLFLIRLMQKYDLVFPLTEEEQKWLVPQALADSQPTLDPDWQKNATRLRWTYSALPEGLMPRFITRTHSLSEGNPRWLNGVILGLDGASAVVRSDPTDRCITAAVIGPKKDRQQLAGTVQREMRDLNSDIHGLNPLEELELENAPGTWVPVTGLEQAEREETPMPVILTPKGTTPVDATAENNRLSVPDARNDSWKPRVFISYSHKDDAAKDRLVQKLKVLEVAGLVDFWVDRDLSAGEAWNRGIENELERMDVFLILVSDHSLTSEYIDTVELDRALERQQEKSAEVVPVILERCQWKAVDRFSHLQALPKDGKPVKDHRPHAVGWHEVSEGLRKLFVRLKKRHATERRSVERFTK